MSSELNWPQSLDRAAQLWKNDDCDAAIDVLKKAVESDRDNVLLKLQKFLMEKAVEYRDGAPQIDMPPRNDEDPVVTVVMPTYNRTRWIRESIESVCEQDFEEWELIVVNDGGTDEVEEIVKSLGDPRVSYVMAEHGGRASALNEGLKGARGRYICFLDDDDIYYPNHIGSLVKAMEENPESPACYSDTIQAVQVPDGDDYKIIRKKVARTFDFELAPMVLKNYVQSNTVLLRREVFLRNGGFNLKLSCLNDRDMWIRIASNEGDFTRVPGATTEFRQRKDGSNISSNSDFRHLHFSNVLITMYKGLFLESRSLGVWSKKRAMRALKYFLDTDS